MSTDIHTLVTDYMTAWNAPTTSICRDKLLACFDANAVYIDPNLDETVTGIDQMYDVITNFHETTRVWINSQEHPAIHHGFFRIRWQLQTLEGRIHSTGIFVGEVNDEMKITKIISFVDDENATDTNTPVKTQEMPDDRTR